MAKKQLEVPETERPDIEVLTNAAEVLRLAKEERAGISAKIADAQAHLDLTVLQCIEDGDIELPDKLSFSKEVIYVYEDESGKLQDVKYSASAKSDVSGHKGAVSPEDDEF